MALRSWTVEKIAENAAKFTVGGKAYIFGGMGRNSLASQSLRLVTILNITKTQIEVQAVGSDPVKFLLRTLERVGEKSRYYADELLSFDEGEAKKEKILAAKIQHRLIGERQALVAKIEEFVKYSSAEAADVVKQCVADLLATYSKEG